LPDRRPITWLDVFTSQPLAGNALCVMHDADEVPDSLMLAIAREAGLSETTFIQRPTIEGADYRNRIFSPPGELPFAGHPSLGTAVAYARRRGDRSARYVQQTQAGLQPIEVELTGLRAHASMVQQPAQFGTAPDPELAATALGLRLGDLVPGVPPQVVSTGVPHLLVPVADGALLAHLRLQAGELAALLDQLGVICVYLAAVRDDGRVRARSFYIDRGLVAEDPATGSAAGPLVALLDRAGVASSIEIDQGAEMARPSRLLAKTSPGGITVGGEAVVVAEAALLV
jgi:trans-2,3-dihydro-3-hydroxyanthranilate isomerase